MQTLTFLNLVISIVFIYLILSLICSTVMELIASATKLRAKTLEQWILKAFKTEAGSLGNMILNHPVVTGLSVKGRRNSYIPSSIFVTAMLDSIVNSGDKQAGIGGYNIQILKKRVEATELLSKGFKNYLLQSIEESEGQIAEVRKSLELWYEKSNERIAGTYKRNAQWIILGLSFVVTFTLNADTVAFFRYFNSNPKQAEVVASLAERVTIDSLIVAKIEQLKMTETDSMVSREITSDEFLKNIKEVKASNTSYLEMLDDAKIPLGWDKSNCTEDCCPGLTKILGLLITTLAVSLGAPFWFDMLNKLTNLRSSGNLKIERTEKPS